MRMTGGSCAPTISSRLAAAKVDVVYVLTAKRSEGAWLGEEASQLLSAYLALPTDLQEALLRLVGDLDRHFAAGRPTLHSGRQDYRAEEPG